MRRTTLGQLLIDQALPEDMRGQPRTLDAKGVSELLQQVAEFHPGDYRRVAKYLTDIGKDVAQATGGFSFGLKHMRQARAYHIAKVNIERDIDRILASRATPEEKQHQLIETVHKRQKPLEDEIYQESLADENPLALQILSGSRGKPPNLKSLRGADLLYQDHRDQIIPFPVLRSYSQGLTPAEYFAGAFGARKGVVDVKEATRDAGYYGKILNQVAHRLIVTKHDDERDQEHLKRGLPVETDDPDNEGALLSMAAGGYPRNTVLTPRVLKDIQAKGIKRILARSPIVGGPPEGGLYGRDVGVRERGMIAPIGDQVGLAASQAISEPISQGGLSSKHQGGVVGGHTISGFKLLDLLTQVPLTFPGGATHADIDGRVHHIEDAPAGGKFVTIEGMQHFVAPGMSLKVNKGDDVEAGDVISDGIPNPAKVVEHKGVGAGRKYFVHTFLSAMRDAGLSGDRRNVELLARGLINHVHLHEEMGPHGPGDVVQYDSLEHAWKPRPGTRTMHTKSATGRYLETPVLHYTIGTKIRPSVIKDLQEFGINDIDVHDEPPPFSPEMVRGIDSLGHDPDWRTRMLGGNAEKKLLHGTWRGDVSDPTGTSFVASLADDPVQFGRRGKVKGYEAPPAPKPSNFRSVLD